MRELTNLEKYLVRTLLVAPCCGSVLGGLVCGFATALYDPGSWAFGILLGTPMGVVLATVLHALFGWTHLHIDVPRCLAFLGCWVLACTVLAAVLGGPGYAMIAALPGYVLGAVHIHLIDSRPGAIDTRPKSWAG